MCYQLTTGAPGRIATSRVEVERPTGDAVVVMAVDVVNLMRSPGCAMVAAVQVNGFYCWNLQTGKKKYKLKFVSISSNENVMEHHCSQSILPLHFTMAVQV